MMLRNLFDERVAVALDGRAVVPVRWPGEYTVRGRVSDSRRTLTGFTPGKVALPGVAVTTLQVGAKQLQAVLEFRGK